MGQNDVRCQGCNTKIGWLAEYHGIELLMIGDTPTREWRGFCPNCGRVIHWSISDKFLESLIKRASNPAKLEQKD